MEKFTHTSECDWCHTKITHDLEKHRIPLNWYEKKIKSKFFLLCNQCGNPARFSGGLPPDLKEMLKLKYGIIFDDE